ncbi:MAG: NAD(P)H-binding protein [Muribaculaceae bacterium]|nr:NAD(P)H-binding protein [Muribaculaceae bacterium]MDE6134085.1 NAD(P)H-binding protein [Muribaculaceae bacterium]
MKEIALLGTVNRVQANVLGELLGRGVAVNAMVDFPEKVMLDYTTLTVTHLPVNDHERLVEALEGYAEAVLAYNDDLEDAYTNDLALKHFVDTVHAAREAGVKRLIVVGSPDSQAFFVSDLRRLDDIDWVFISTENAYPQRVADELIDPRFHKEIYTED